MRDIGNSRAGMMGGNGAQPITAEAVLYNGSGEYVELLTALTGISASYTGMLSMWFRLEGSDAKSIHMITLMGDRIQLFRTTANKLHLNLFSDGYTSTLTFTSTPTYTADSTWHHIALSWDLNAGAGSKTIQVFVDGSSIAGTVVDSSSAFQVNATSNYYNRESGSSGNWMDGAISETYVNMAERLDISDSSNLEKFRSSSGETMDLGSDGSLPTGTAPIVYLKSNAANREVNSGSGGNFTAVTGTITDTTPPS